MHATVCDSMTDLVQNAIEAGASRVELEVSTGPARIELRVTDNGKGMDEAALARARDPFFSEPGKHDRRRVGLGLPFLLQAAGAANGAVEVRSAPGQGTEVRCAFDAAHVDTPPLGDLAATVVGLLAFAGDYELVVTRRAPQGAYTLARSDLAAALGNLEEAGNLALARRYVVSQEESLTDTR